MAERTQWDTKVPGLHLRHRATRSSWHLYYRIAGRAKNPKIGDGRVLSLTQAREIGRQWLAAVARGEDPCVDRHVQKPTVRDMYAKFALDNPDKVKPKTWDDCYEPIWRLHILPLLGSTAVADLSLADASKLKTRLSATPHQANRALSVLHRACELAETEWGWRPLHSNPVKVERYVEQQRRRVPSRQEAEALLAAIETRRASDPYFVAFIDLLLLTGCRKGEWIGAKWEWVIDGRLQLPDSKVGARSIPLNSQALAVLAAIPRLDGNPYVLPGRFPGEAMTAPRKAWDAVRLAAGLPDLRMHDLRRYFASLGLSAGLTLEAVGQLLGHSQAQTTKRYAYLLEDAQRLAAETAGAALVAVRTQGRNSAQPPVDESALTDVALGQVQVILGAKG